MLSAPHHLASYWACLLAAWLCLLPRHLGAQAAKGTWYADIHQFGTSNGLSHNDLHAVAVDERGILWVGAANGLNRFDGRYVKYFGLGAGLYAGAIHEIFQDGPYLWLLYKDFTGGQRIRHIELFDVYAERIVPLAERFDLPFAPAHLHVARLIGTDALLFIEHSGRAHAYIRGQGFQHLGFLAAGEQAVLYDDAGAWWTFESAGGWSYVRQRDAGGQVLGEIKLPALRCQYIEPLRWSGQKLTFGVSDEGQIHVKALLHLDRAMRYDLVSDLPPGYDRVLLNDIVYIPDAEGFWAMSNNGAATYLWDARGRFSQDLPALGVSLFNRQPLVQGGVLWMPTNAGLFRASLRRNPFEVWLPQVPLPSLRGIAKIDDALYVASGNGVFRLRPGQAPAALPAFPFALALASDGAGRLWGGNNARLFGFHPPTGSKSAHRIPYNEPWVLRADSDGHIWMSQWGLCRFNPANDSCEQVQAPDFPEFAAQTVYYIYPRADGNTWWLCSTGGIYVLDVARRRIVARYWSGGEGPYALSADEVRHLCYDEQAQSFWLATGGGELLCWPQNGGKIRRYHFEATQRAALHAVYADAAGNLWLSSDNGLIQFKKSIGVYRRYSIADGLPSNEFNRISHFQDRDGRLYFGSVLGLVSFHPQDFAAAWAEAAQVAPLLIEAQVYDGRGALRTLGQEVQAGAVLPFFPSDRFIALHFGLSDLNQGAALRYEYRLEGQDNSDWAPLSSNELLLGRLPYGRQVLLIRTWLDNGLLAGQVLEVPIDVRVPFFLTWWFFLGLLGLLVLFIWWRTANLRRSNRALEDEVRRRTRTIEAQAAELRELDEVKSRFFVNISHELRTPLTLILAPAQRIWKTPPAAEELPGLAEVIVRNGQRLMKMVDEILDLSKLEAGTVELSERPVHLRPVLQQVVALFAPHAQRLNIALAFHDELPPQLHLMLDAEKIETILSNLLSNALKFTAPGGQVVLLARKDEGGRLVLTVSDTGRGIAAADLPRVFDRFFQAKGEKAEGGTGLGLALSRELAHLMGGRIWVESKPGQGSHFHLRLPWRAAKAPLPNIADSAGPAAGKSAQPPSHRSVPHLLIVEDHPDLQDYLRQLLAKDYQIAVANHGAEALDYLAQAQQLPDLVLSDIMMPVMDGYKLLSLLKNDALYSRIPVLMLTARAAAQDRLQALRIGVDDYMTKPFDEDELRIRIQRLLERAELREAAVPPAELPEDMGTAAQRWLARFEEEARISLLQNSLSVEHLAHRMGSSRQTLNRQIKALTGLTATQYFQELRLAHARELLEAKVARSVKMAAQQAGFADVKYFSRQFKERYGRLPSELLGE